jgi:signal transduction histidine kinase
MVQHIAELTRTLLECEYVSVILVEPEKDQLHLVSVVGASKEQEHGWFTAVENLFLYEALDAGSLSRLREGEVLQLPQTQPLLRVIRTTSVQKALLAPLRFQERFTGMLILHPEAKKRTYSLKEKKAVAKVVGTFVASIIERERFVNEQAAVHVQALAMEVIDQRMSDFLSLIGHELRTPLTALKSNVWLATNLLNDVLLHMQEEETLRSLVEDVRDVLSRVDQLVGVQNQLVSELLDASYLSVNKLKGQFESHDLTTFVLQRAERLASTGRKQSEANRHREST